MSDRLKVSGGDQWWPRTPRACDPELIKPLPPLDANDERLRMWYDAALKLVVHDDSLNWQKFYNMAYANLGLIAAYAFAVDKGFKPLLFLICSFAIVVGYGFHVTLREGMRCLSAHRCKIDMLDE